MSHDTKRLAESNALLARADSDLPPYQVAGRTVLPGTLFQRYKWCWSEELLTAMPVFTADGKYELEYICGCGTNKAVHSPTCNSLTVAAVKFIQFKVEPMLPNCFALCQWTPPPSEDYWASNYGSFRYYPRNGLYRPLSVKHPREARGIYINVPYPHAPFPETTMRVIDMLKDHYAKSDERLAAMERFAEVKDRVKTRDYTPPPGSAWARIRDAVADKTTMHGVKPGEKGSVSRFHGKPDDPVGPLIEIAS